MKIKLYPSEAAARRAFNFHVARTKGNPVVNPATRTCVVGDRSLRFEYIASKEDLDRFKGLNPTSVEVDDSCDAELAGMALAILLRRR